MMSRFSWQREIRRFGLIVCIVAVIAVMTGPAGSQQAAASGFKGSLFEHVSFFGLFPAFRWMVFFAFALIIEVVLAVRNKYPMFSVRDNWTRASASVRDVTRRRSIRWSSYGLALLVAILLPKIVTDPFWQTQMVEGIGVYVLLAIGLNVVVGFAGLLDLGYVAFYAIGAYATAWVTGSLPLNTPFHIHLNPFFAIPVAIVFVMIAGILLGIPTLRLRGDYLAIVTLGFGEITTIFANNLYGVTGGSIGTSQIPHFSIHLGPLKYQWGISPVPYYYLTVAFIVLFIVAFSMLEHSRVGRAWTAIREDELAAESVGINPLKYKVMAFAIGAASAGFAGVMTAAQIFFLSPADFTLQFSILILVLVIFGGMGSIKGVVVGAIIIQTIAQYLAHSPPPGYQIPDLYMYLGAILIVMMIMRPAGLFPSKRRQREIAIAEGGEGHMDEVLSGDDV